MVACFGVLVTMVACCLAAPVSPNQLTTPRPTIRIVRPAKTGATPTPAAAPTKKGGQTGHDTAKRLLPPPSPAPPAQNVSPNFYAEADTANQVEQASNASAVRGQKSSRPAEAPSPIALPTPKAGVSDSADRKLASLPTDAVSQFSSLTYERTRAVVASLIPAARSFNTDYRTRPAGAPIPLELRGRGLNGRDLPIGGEDAYRDQLPPDFMPTDLVLVPVEWCYANQPVYLRREAAESLVRMFRDAAREGLTLRIFSGYRDIRHQQRIYSQTVGRRGRASRTAARPGKSEHQLGTTADVTSTERYVTNPAFANTPEGRWLAKNAERYGWRFTVVSGSGARKRVVEPWHIRYFGRAGPGSPPSQNVAETKATNPLRTVLDKIRGK
jgi:hypothetical protein